MRNAQLLCLIFLVAASGCLIVTDTKVDERVGQYYLQRVNDQVLPNWPIGLRIETPQGSIEIVRPSSLSLRANGTFLQEHNLVERPDGAPARWITKTWEGTYQMLGTDMIQLTGSSGNSITGTLGRGQGKVRWTLLLSDDIHEGVLISTTCCRICTCYHERRSAPVLRCRSSGNSPGTDSQGRA